MKIKNLSLLISVLIMTSLTTIVLSIFSVIRTINVKPIPENITYEIVYKPDLKIELEPSPIEIAMQEMNAKMKGIEIIGDKKEWFVAYKSISDEYRNIIELPKTVYDCLSEEDVYLIQRVVETECYGASFDAKVNVANVVFNRINSGKFGETVEDIVTSPNQFAYGKKHITQDTILAVEYAFELEDTTDGALFFHSNTKTNKFNGAEFIFQDKVGHCFYK